ncbi:MAG: S-layer homology domain-containing protein, partial [Pseudoflavonifractor sp.]
NGLLNGRKGTLLLNDEGFVLTFVPAKNTNAKTFTVSRAETTYLTDATGFKYTVDVSTAAYYQGEKTDYITAKKNIRPGTVVTVCYGSSGKAEYVYVDAEASMDAVVVAANGSTIGFDSLTGGAGNYKIYKNGVPASAGDLRQHDVATYSPATGIIHVSDTRLTGCLEDVYPNLETVTKITVLGNVFTVLPSGINDFAGLKVGGQVTLLLTNDNKVAGAVENSQTARSNAIGEVISVSATSATVRLFNGLELSGNPQLAENTAQEMTGQLVTVSSYRSGYISLSRLSSGAAAGTLDVAARKLGDRALAENVRVYEKVGNSVLKPIALSQLSVAKVPGSKIVYVGSDWANRVSILVLNDVTGDCYTYGKANFTGGKSDGEWSYTNATVSVTNGDGVAKPATSATYECGNGFTDGQFI